MLDKEISRALRQPYKTIDEFVATVLEVSRNNITEGINMILSENIGLSIRPGYILCLLENGNYEISLSQALGIVLKEYFAQDNGTIKQLVQETGCPMFYHAGNVNIHIYPGNKEAILDLEEDKNEF